MNHLDIKKIYQFYCKIYIGNSKIFLAKWFYIKYLLINIFEIFKRFNLYLLSDAIYIYLIQWTTMDLSHIFMTPFLHTFLDTFMTPCGYQTVKFNGHSTLT